MDIDFETPLVIQVQEEEPLDCAKGFRKFGGMLMDTLTSPPSEGASDAPPPLKKKTGFFGIGGGRPSSWRTKTHMEGGGM